MADNILENNCCSSPIKESIQPFPGNDLNSPVVHLEEEEEEEEEEEVVIMSRGCPLTYFRGHNRHAADDSLFWRAPVGDV